MLRAAMDRARHLLIVDDDVGIRALLSDFLARHGYRVSAAQNGAGMMQRLRAAQIDLIILDIMMPGEDGLSLCRRVNGTIPIIMLTAVGGGTDRVVGLETGGDVYLPKPFNKRQLLARALAGVLRCDLSPPGSASCDRRVL